MKLILASASPRRAEILRNAGFEFSILPTTTDETRLPNEPADKYVARVASMKAIDAAARSRALSAHAVIIAADTVVLADSQILGKPKDAADARRMLHLLSGSVHDVLTGLAVMRATDSTPHLNVETTRVHFAKLSDQEIEAYVSTGEPMDKAGAYGIQGIGGKFVTRIEGCYFNVMGLPLSRFWTALRAMEQHRK